MAESILITATDKKEKYEELIPQVKALTNGEQNLIANMANIAAALKEAFDFFWVGFYLVNGEQLVLGPFQGPVACTRIHYGKGVCGTAWKEKQSVIVPDVEAFPGHIACSAASQSEIVVPGFEDGAVAFVLDVDSDQKDSFDETDQFYLEKLLKEALGG